MTVYRGEVVSEAEVGLPTPKGVSQFPISFGYQVVGRVREAGPDAPYAAGALVLCEHPHQDGSSSRGLCCTRASRQRSRGCSLQRSS
jgi:hypothetical protein